MAIKDVLVPQLSESVSEATLLTWKKPVGAKVEADEILIEIETDKVVLEVPAPISGVLVEITKEAGALVNSGEVIARIDPQATAQVDLKAGSNTVAQALPVSSLSATKPSAGSGVSKESIASPSASKIMADENVHSNSVKGTGVAGRITKGDVLNALQNTEKSSKPIAAATLSSSLTQPVQNQTLLAGERLEKRVPMSRVRARIAERLLQSQQQNAILTTFNEVNMQAVMTLRNKYKEKFEKEHQVKLGFMSFFVKAALAALKKFPIINASVDGKDIIYHGYFDIGIAVGSSRGLVVPILRNVDQLSIADIERQIAEFGMRANEGKLTLDELTGGTFSISNGGVFGSMLSTPIINPPQAAILGIHATKERAVVEQGQIVIRPMNYLALSYDHRIIDGREAVLALVAIKEALEDPQRLLLEI